MLKDGYFMGCVSLLQCPKMDTLWPVCPCYHAQRWILYGLCVLVTMLKNGYFMGCVSLLQCPKMDTLRPVCPCYHAQRWILYGLCPCYNAQRWILYGLCVLVTMPKDGYFMVCVSLLPSSKMDTLWTVCPCYHAQIWILYSLFVHVTMPKYGHFMARVLVTMPKYGYMHFIACLSMLLCSKMDTLWPVCLCYHVQRLILYGRFVHVIYHYYAVIQ